MTNEHSNTSEEERLAPQLQYAFETEILHQWSFVQAAVQLMNAALEHPITPCRVPRCQWTKWWRGQQMGSS